jgi:hypothetical protein
MSLSLEEEAQAHREAAEVALLRPQFPEAAVPVPVAEVADVAVIFLPVHG